MSGTIVERRDQVFTTFFSLRVFSASTLSRKWPSTNGPFFVERAIACLFLHAAQTPPLGVPHLLETPHRTRNTVRPRTERANKTRAQSIGCPIHNHRPAGLAQLVQHRLERYDYFDRGLGGHFRRQSFYCSLHRPRPASCSACGTCTCRSHFSALPSRPCQHQPGTAFAVLLTLGALVQDCAPSLQSSVISSKLSVLLPRLRTYDLELQTLLLPALH